MSSHVQKKNGKMRPAKISDCTFKFLIVPLNFGDFITNCTRNTDTRTLISYFGDLL